VASVTQLAHSKHRHAQKVAAHMFKTAAILTQLNHGYEQIMRPEQTACLD
jgi:hypothetical protein